MSSAYTALQHGRWRRVGGIVIKTPSWSCVFQGHNFFHFNYLHFSTYIRLLHASYTVQNILFMPQMWDVWLFMCIVCVKDSQISSLERGLRELEDQVMMLRSSNMLTCEERQEEVKQMEVYRNHTKFMKNKVEQVQGVIINEDLMDL